MPSGAITHRRALARYLPPDANALAYINALNTVTSLSTAQQVGIYDLVATAKANGVWSSLVAVWPYLSAAGASSAQIAQQQVYNLVNPANYVGQFRLYNPAVNTGGANPKKGTAGIIAANHTSQGVAFTGDLGSGNNSTFFDPGIIIHSIGTGGNCGFSFLIRNDLNAPAAAVLSGVTAYFPVDHVIKLRSSNQMVLKLRQQGGDYSPSANGGAAYSTLTVTAANTASTIGFWTFLKNGTTVKVYKDGALQATYSITNSPAGTYAGGNPYVGASNESTQGEMVPNSFSAYTVGAVAFHAGDLTDAQAANLYNLVNAFEALR